MDPLLGAVRVISQVLFVLLGIAAVRHRLKRGGAAAGWLALTFGTLAAVVLLGAVLPEDPQSTALRLAQRADIALLAAFPYLLFRFATSFDPPSRWLRIVAPLGVAVLVVWTFFLPEFPGEGAPRPAAFQAYLFAFLTVWSLLSVVVTVKLWRGGSGQPSVAQKRMRLLSIGALALNVALLVAGLGSGDAAGAVELTTQLLAILAAALFYLGFAPPTVVRILWRRPEEAALRSAEAGLMEAVSTDAVTHAILPRAVDLLGGRGALMTHPDGQVMATHRLDRDQALDLAPGIMEARSRGEAAEVEPGVIGLRLSDAWLGVVASRYTPFFGREELDLVESLGAFTDLALGRARLYESEQVARREAEAANAELEGFVYSVSHDLRNPLITILGYLDYLTEDYGSILGHEGRHYADRMASSARYMHDLINDLLELSRVGRLQTETQPVDLEQLVRDVGKDLQSTSPEATLEVDDLPTVAMNPVRARQLLTNLIENAAAHAGRPDVHIRVRSRSLDGGGGEISVADDGPGIPAEYRKRVFGVFERLEGAADPGTDGTGIGLAICTKIVGQLGGEIWVADSEIGTDVRFTLPEEVIAKPTPDPTRQEAHP